MSTNVTEIGQLLELKDEIFKMVKAAGNEGLNEYDLVKKINQLGKKYPLVENSGDAFASLHSNKYLKAYFPKGSMEWKCCIAEC